MYDSKYTSFRTAQWTRSDNAHCHPYNDEVAIGCHGTGVREEEDFVPIIRTIFFIIVEVGEASQGKS